MTNTIQSTRHIVILGGGYAGLTVANRLARLSGTISITLVDATPRFQQRIRLHQAAAGQAISGFEYESVLAPLGIRFELATVTSLDPNACALTLNHPDGKASVLTYDYLVYALGSRIDRSLIAGAENYSLAPDTTEEAATIHSRIMSKPDSRLLVIGAGLTGIELATELAESFPHSQVTLAKDSCFQAGSEPGDFSPAAVDYLQRSFAQLNVSVRQNCFVTQLVEGKARLIDGNEILYDTCILASGFMASALAKRSGIEVNVREQVVTDSALRSISHPNIIAVGDAAQVRTSDGNFIRMSCATGLAMAASGARTVSALLSGQQPPDFNFVYLFRNISLGRRDGLIQFVDKQDAPRRIIWTGKKAVRWKEFICRSTLSTMGIDNVVQPPLWPPLRLVPQVLAAAHQYA